MEFFNSLTTSIFGGESKVNNTPSSVDAQVLGNPEREKEKKKPQLSSSTSTTSTTSTTTTTTTSTTTLPAHNEEEDMPSNFAQFRQISLPGEWTHDSTDPDSDVGSGRFKFGL